MRRTRTRDICGTFAEDDGTDKGRCAPPSRVIPCYEPPEEPTPSPEVFYSALISLTDTCAPTPEPEPTSFALFGWGFNDTNQLGQSPASDVLSPTQTGVDETWTMVKIGKNHALGIKEDGTLWAWGNNSKGELGLGDTTPRTVPTQVGTDTDWVSCVAAEANAGGQFNGWSAAIKAGGTLWTWGENSDRQLGQGDQVDRNVPTQVGTDSDWTYIDGHYWSLLAVKTNGTFWGCGRNTQGQLGIGNYTNQDTLQQGLGSGWERVYQIYEHSFGIKTNGSLWAWGFNGNGQFGNGGIVPSVTHTPTQIGSDGDWKAVSGGELFSVATKTTGTMWVTGESSDGALGLGATTNALIWTQIGSGTDWDYPSCGLQSSTAIKTDGTIWATGYNGDGNLGQGNTSDLNVFTQVGSGTTWQLLAGGEYSTMALQTPA